MQSEGRIIDPLLSEMELESHATQKMLERVPADRLTWKPHDKSMSLGQLAYHLATVADAIGNFLGMDSFDAATADFRPVQPDSKEEILKGFEEASASARAKLEALTDEEAMSEWKMTKGEEVLWEVPKIALARTLMFNHVYHHRGQLSVYLRLLGVPVPITYGATADENPFN